MVRGLNSPREVDDAVGAPEERLELVALDVGAPPLRLGYLTARSPPGRPEDLVDPVVVGKHAQEARADVAAGSGDDDAHLGLLPPRDRAGELALRHLRATFHAEPPSALVQLVPRVLLDVDAAERLPNAAPLLRRRLLRARIARAALVLRDPAVAALLVRVLEGGHRRAMRPLAFAVLLAGG